MNATATETAVLPKDVRLPGIMQFCSSMADYFDSKVELEVFHDMFSSCTCEHFYEGSKKDFPVYLARLDHDKLIAAFGKALGKCALHVLWLPVSTFVD